MAISENGQFALLALNTPWMAPLPFNPGTLGTDDEQQLLNGFPDITWAPSNPTPFVLDLNTRIFVYEKPILLGNDLTSMATRDLNSRTGDMSNRVIALIDDATP